jgi:hypothetical protein
VAGACHSPVRTSKAGVRQNDRALVHQKYLEVGSKLVIKN